MSARLCVLAALAALAACALCGASGRDPLPAALTELVKSGSFSSSEELQLLLLSDSVDDEQEDSHANNTNSRLPRSLLDAQPAQQALCKVRTEVMEVTRSMLDRSNAHFLLWPPCVEVQRCSGCCNTKNLKCVPVLTHTRYLQVMKIQYANKRPVYNKAVVSVNDHVECRCQPVPRPAPRRKSLAHKQEARDRVGRPRHKEELHHQDELKHSQRLHLEDLIDHSWLPREKHSEPYTSAGFLPSDGQEIHFGHDGWTQNKTHLSGHRDHYHGDGRKENGSSNGTRPGSSEILTASLPNHTEKEKTERSLLLLNVTRSGLKEQFHKSYIEIQQNATVSKHNLVTYKKVDTQAEIANQIPLNESGLSSQVQRNESSYQLDDNQKHSAFSTRQTNVMHEVTTDPTKEMQGVILSPAKEQSEKLKGNETPELERTQGMEEKESSTTLLMEKQALEEEKEELLLLHKLLDEEKHKHILKTQHSEQENQKHSQKHKKTYTTTQSTVTTSSAPLKVSPHHKPLQPPPKPPRPPPQPPKRRRKHRNRISKAAMRAMLM